MGYSKFSENAHEVQDELPGTHPYIAPEILTLRVERKKVLVEHDRERLREKISTLDWNCSDVYSVAIVLWKLFHQDGPAFDENVHDPTDKILRGERPSVWLTRAAGEPQVANELRGLWENLVGLVQEAWADEPNARPSANCLLTQLLPLIIDERMS